MRVLFSSQLLLLFTMLFFANGAYSAQVCRANTNLSAPDSRFIINNDGTVTDLETGLMWMRCTVGQSGAVCTGGASLLFTWDAALQYAEDINFGAGISTFNDWRVPNVNELISLTETSCENPSLNLNVFPLVNVNETYWSSTPSHVLTSGVENKVWAAGYLGGTWKINGYGTRDSEYYLRLVRGGLHN